jgi:hypothetical protein
MTFVQSQITELMKERAELINNIITNPSCPSDIVGVLPNKIPSNSVTDEVYFYYYPEFLDLVYNYSFPIIISLIIFAITCFLLYKKFKIDFLYLYQNHNIKIIKFLYYIIFTFMISLAIVLLNICLYFGLMSISEIIDPTILYDVMMMPLMLAILFWFMYFNYNVYFKY